MNFQLVGLIKLPHITLLAKTLVFTLQPAEFFAFGLQMPLARKRLSSVLLQLPLQLHKKTV
jgi:hypothetical protein